MPKYIRTRATRSSHADNDGLRDALLKQLEREGEKLLKRMMGDFSRTLEKETGRILGDVLGGARSTGATRTRGNGSGETGLQASLVSSAASLVSLLVAERNNRVRTQTSSSESRRSRETEQAFRVSRAQSMAEATQALARSERNQ